MDRAKEIEKYIKDRIELVMEFYIRGDAIDCKSTRDNINTDLESILTDAELKYKTKFKRRLRVLAFKNNIIDIGWQNLDLN